MGGNETIHLDGDFMEEPFETVKISFPNHSSPLDDVPPPLHGNSVKIDYTAISIPPPKKTIGVRRPPRTRVVHLDEAICEEKAEEKIETNRPADAVADSLQKLLKGVETVNQAALANQRQNSAIVATLEKQAAILPRIEALQKHLDQSHKVETANQRLFDAMHEELKGYKDNFLLDSLQKPVIRDLVTLFDDLCGQTGRVTKFLKETTDVSEAMAPWKKELEASRDNLNNTVFFIVEVLNRLDVTLLESECDNLDLKQHKVVGFEPTATPEEKNQIARVVRPGFLWRKRILRPTDVIVKKYSPAPPVENEESSEASS